MTALDDLLERKKRRKKATRAKAWVKRNELDIRLHALKTLFAIPAALKSRKDTP